MRLILEVRKIHTLGQEYELKVTPTTKIAGEENKTKKASDSKMTTIIRKQN